MAAGAEAGSIDGVMLILLLIALVIVLIIGLFSIVCNWKIFGKAGQSKWASLVPIYNTYVLIKAAGLAGWYFALYFIPVANIYATIRVKYDLTKRFGYGSGMALLYIFIPIIPMFVFAFKGKYTVIEKNVVQENVNPHSAEATDPVVDPFMNFTPVQGENAVPYEEGTVAYFPEEKMSQNVEIQLPEELKVEEVIEEEKTVEEVVFKPIAPAVPFEVGTVAYEQPKKPEPPKEVVVVKREPVIMEDMPEPETIVIPTGQQFSGNVVIPEGVNAPIVGEINQNVTSTEGNKSNQMKVCPKCGMKIETFAEACFMCGTKF